MASKKFCDICEGECKSSGWYNLTYTCLLGRRKEDICHECMKKIKSYIKGKEYRRCKCGEMIIGNGHTECWRCRTRTHNDKMTTSVNNVE